MIGEEGIYAIIIIALVVVFSLIACVGLHMIRRKGHHNKKKQESRTDEWQQLHSAIASTPVDSTLQAISTWQSKHPPNTTQFIDVKQHAQVIEKGVCAWRFVESEALDNQEESNAAVMDDDSLVFCQGSGSILTNLPVPLQEFSYWEVKILQLSEQDRLAIGFATKPYPQWRLPGWHRHSVAYHSDTGSIFASDPRGRPYSSAYKQGDVIGVGYLYQTGTVFFTRNGQNLGKASIGFKYPLYPIVGCMGPAHVQVNFGLQDFLFTPANQREAAYAARQGSLLPPPAYGGHLEDTMLFEQDNNPQLTYIDTTIQPPPPSYS